MLKKNNKVYDKLSENLGQLLSYTLNEAILIARMEEFFDPQPAKIADSEEEARKINVKLNRVVAALGGPPQIIVVADDENRPIYDTYSSAAIDEIFSTFKRCRHSVCKAHLFMIAFPLVKKHPDWWKPPQTCENAAEMSRIMEERFWDEAETAFIRLASFWDRLGQLLDFVFFNIRQYEHDGFPAVMKRILKNFIPVFIQIKECKSWIRLWSYTKSEKNDGLVWLLRRRNLLVHSLHFRPGPMESHENPIFTSAYNHLKESVRNILKPGEPQEELENLHTQLALAALHFHDAIELCALGADIQKEALSQ